MRNLSYLIDDVREATDNEDTNGVSDKEIIRYFQDAIRSIQAIIFKNNPLCSYFQNSFDVASPVAGTVQDLPSDTYADNAVSFVEVQTDASAADRWSPLDRCWQEDQNSFVGWFTRNKSIVFTGRQDVSVARTARVWYFQRLARWDKVWATVNGAPVGQVITIVVSDTDYSTVAGHITIVDSDGEVKLAGLKYSVTTPTTLTIVGDISTVVSGDQILMGANAVLDIDLPEEVESYLLDYVAKRVVTRNNYNSDSGKIEYFTEDDRANITAIFADIGQSQVRTPITDTDFLRV